MRARELLRVAGAAPVSSPARGSRGGAPGREAAAASSPSFLRVVGGGGGPWIWDPAQFRRRRAPAFRRRGGGRAAVGSFASGLRWRCAAMASCRRRAGFLGRAGPIWAGAGRARLQLYGDSARCTGGVGAIDSMDLASGWAMAGWRPAVLSGESGDLLVSSAAAGGGLGVRLIGRKSCPTCVGPTTTAPSGVVFLQGGAAVKCRHPPIVMVSVSG